MTAVRENLIHLMKHLDRLNNEALCELMPKILSTYPGIGWEIGPNAARANKTTLALSAPYYPDRLHRLSKDLCLPVETNEWDIVAGIPPRAWERFFLLSTDAGETFRVEGNGWMWQLASSLDSSERFPIRLLVVGEMSVARPETIHEAAQLLLIGELGENNYSKSVQIASVTAVNDGNFRAMDSLRRDFINKFPQCEYSTYLVGHS